MCKTFEGKFLSTNFRKEISKGKLLTVCKIHPDECNIRRLKPENVYVRQQAKSLKVYKKKQKN